MNVLWNTVRRSLVMAVFWPTLLVAVGASWLAVQLVSGSLGPTEQFLAEIRHGSLLFAGLLVLSMAEPLEVSRDARDGLLLLRATRSGTFALPARWVGLTVAMLPAVLAAGLVSGGLPAAPLALGLELAILSAGGLALGSFLDRSRLVPALWVLAVAGHLRPWLEATAWGQPAAWLLPDLGGLDGGGGAALLHGAAWVSGALLIARWRLAGVAARGRWPSGGPPEAPVDAGAAASSS